MKITVRAVDTALSRVEFVSIKDVISSEPSMISLDVSSTNTGLAFYTLKGNLVYSIAFTREESEDFVEYKVDLKRHLKEILDLNSNMKAAYYEEPFGGYVDSAKILFSLRTSVTEIKAEYRPRYDYLEFVEISNGKWKKIFLAPDKMPPTSDLQKKAVRKKVLERYPFLVGITEDEADAIGLAEAVLFKKKTHSDNSMISHKKVSKFAYEIRFVGADTEEDLFQEFNDCRDMWKIPSKVMDNGVELVGIDGRGKFEQKIYDNMGSDDKVLILGFKKGTNSNLVLQYELANIAFSNNMIYAIVWRKNRKK